VIDENAFGLLISYFTIESDEYLLEREAFVERYCAFRSALLECVAALPLGPGTRGVDLGHALYFEIADGDEDDEPLRWLRSVRDRMTDIGFVTVGVMTYGGRWVEVDAPPPASEQAADVSIVRASLPSEPLRRALDADGAARASDHEPDASWGPGLYVDVEAVEALGKTLRNAPTPLHAGGALFYRVGS
jgi:hypothetical protein